MTRDEIINLGTLSRLALSETEITNFTSEIAAIVAYVSQVDALASGEVSVHKVGPVYNRMREDVVTVASGTYREGMLNAAPARVGDFFEVKKIIDQGE